MLNILYLIYGVLAAVLIFRGIYSDTLFTTNTLIFWQVGFFVILILHFIASRKSKNYLIFCLWLAAGIVGLLLKINQNVVLYYSAQLVNVVLFTAIAYSLIVNKPFFYISENRKGFKITNMIFGSILFVLIIVILFFNVVSIIKL